MVPVIASAMLLMGGQGQSSVVETPKTRWVFEAAASLQDEGLIAGYPKPINGKSARPMSRYELAVAFNGACTNLKNELEDLRKEADKVAHDAAGSKEAERDASDTASDLKAMRAAPFRKAVEYLPRAQREFSRELATLGVPANSFTSTVNDYRRTMAHFKVPKAGSELSSSRPKNPDAFPDTPTNHWAYEAMSVMKSQGLFAAYPDDTLWRHPGTAKTRYEAAVDFHATMTHLENMLDGTQALCRRLAHEPAGTESESKDLVSKTQLLRTLNGNLYQRSVGYFPRIESEFAPEFKALGVNPHAFTAAAARYRTTIAELEKTQAGSALVQFPDVPAGHWAAKAVLELRRAGILVGYPDGTFNGKS